jgi:ERF superfamily
MSHTRMSKKNVSKPKSLVNKLIEIRHGLGKVEKTKRNPHFGYSYVGLEQLNALIEPRLSELNIFFTTSVVREETRYGDGKAGVFSSVDTEHTFYDADSEQTIVGRSSGLGWDAGDKATAKAITAALKSYLKANFMISDEADDPEAHGEPPESTAPAKGHKRTKPYEEETGEGDTKVAGDLLNFKAFLTEHKIPDGFVLRLLQEKALIDGHTKTVAALKPGVVTRCVTDKAKANLLKAWKSYEADQDSGSATAPDLAAPVPKGKEKALPANEGNGNVVRTDEGDQTVNVVRKPVQNDLSPKEALEQDGYENWRQVPIHFGKQKATPLGKLGTKSLAWWVNEWQPKPYKGTWNEQDLLLDAALVLASKELSGE